MHDTTELLGQINRLTEGQKILEYQNRLLREQVNFLKVKLFGSNTEKRSSLPQEQLQHELFPLEDANEEEGPEAENQGDQDPKPMARPWKRRGARKPIPEWFPRNEIIHELPEEDRICGCGQGLDKIGEETSEQLDWIPARVEVTRHVRIKRACKACEGLETEGGTVQIPPVSAQMLPKSLAGPGLLAKVIVNKFGDGLLFYRQEKRFARVGLRIHRTTMAKWVLKVADKCRDLIEILRDEMLQNPYIQIDEATLPDMKEEGRKNKTKSYMWVIRSAPPGPPIVWFQYHPTRQTAFAQELLRDYKGFVQTDGYQGYGFLDASPKVIHLGCWAQPPSPRLRRVGRAPQIRGRGKNSGQNEASCQKSSCRDGIGFYWEVVSPRAKGCQRGLEFRGTPENQTA